MKASIDVNGQLWIDAETPLEGYAVQMWAKENMPVGNPTMDATKITISWEKANGK